jgi:hypothetical protein
MLSPALPRGLRCKATRRGLELLVLLVCAGVSGLDLTGLLMQPSRAAMGLGLLVMKPSELRIGRGLGFQLGLSLVLERPCRTLERPLFAFDRGIMDATVAHRRNNALAGRCATN